MSKRKALKLGVHWIAEIGAHGMVAGPDSTLQQQPANAIAAACAQEDIDPESLDLIEINEAFAAVGIASTRSLKVDPAKVNVNGGAIFVAAVRPSWACDWQLRPASTRSSRTRSSVGRFRSRFAMTTALGRGSSSSLRKPKRERCLLRVAGRQGRWGI
jgi:Thiolase, C-terminal domain